MIRRNSIPSEYVAYSVYLYFSGLSLRRVSERLNCLSEITYPYGIRFRNTSLKNIIKKKRISECVIDETLIKVDSELFLIILTYEIGCLQAIVLSLSHQGQ